MWTQVSTRAIFFCGEVLGEFPGPSTPGVVKSRQEAAADLVAPLLPLPGQLWALPWRAGERWWEAQGLGCPETGQRSADTYYFKWNPQDWQDRVLEREGGALKLERPDSDSGCVALDKLGHTIGMLLNIWGVTSLWMCVKMLTDGKCFLDVWMNESEIMNGRLSAQCLAHCWCKVGCCPQEIRVLSYTPRPKSTWHSAKAKYAQRERNLLCLL